MAINVQFVYGAGVDGGKLGKGIRELRDRVIAEFGEDVHLPDIIDHLKRDKISDRIAQWNDPIVLIGHSCGVQAISEVAVKHHAESVPYLMGIATSRFCRPVRLLPNVLRATEIMAEKNCFNPRKTQFLVKHPDNGITHIKVVESGEDHVKSSQAKITHSTAIAEIRTAIENNPPPIDGA